MVRVWIAGRQLDIRAGPAGQTTYYRLNAAIHSGINEAAANPLLRDTYVRINARVQSMRFRTNQDEAKWARAVQEHSEMMQAPAERDGAALGRILALPGTCATSATPCWR